MHRQDDFIDMIMSDNNIIASAYSKVDPQKIRASSMMMANQSEE